MEYLKLRIAWSVVWAVAAVLLMVLWVRSYWRSDTLGTPSPFTSCGALFESFDGRARLLILDGGGSPWHWAIDSLESNSAKERLESEITIGEEHGGTSPERYTYLFYFQVIQPPRFLRIHWPHWLAVLL